MNYKTYAEAKIANPDCEIVTTGKDWGGGTGLIGVFEALVLDGTDDEDGAHEISDTSWVICNPADYCSTLKEFLDAGLRLVKGDKFLGVRENVIKVKGVVATNTPRAGDEFCYILSAAALNDGCKIEFIEHKSEPWTIYNNTLPLSELSDEQAAMLFNSWRGGRKVQFLSGDKEWKVKGCNSGFYHSDIYRIKPKSERELFIDAAINHGIKPDAHNAKQIFGELFDSGKFKYIDNTQHFGENI